MSIIDNFEPEIQEFIRENEKKLGLSFIGCLESDNSLVFRGDNIGDIKVIDICFCETTNCEMNRIPIEINWNNFYGMKCSNCGNNFFHEIGQMNEEE